MDTLFTNAAIVLPDAVIRGTVRVAGGRIVEVADGVSGVPGALDMDGDYLLPGAVDVHTDNLERQVQPRAGARWPSRSALLTHDAQCAGAGGDDRSRRAMRGRSGVRRGPAHAPAPRVSRT